MNTTDLTALIAEALSTDLPLEQQVDNLVVQGAWDAAAEV